MLSRFTLFYPLGLAYVAGATPSDWDVRIIDENFEPFRFEEADLVGITAFTANINRAYEIARIYRDRNIKVVLGGIHASMLPDEALEHADAVVIGEAEGVWAQVLQDFECGCLEGKYEGPRMDLSIPGVRPRRDLMHPEYFWESVQTSRGCPFNCDFCSVSRYLGTAYRKRNVDDVLDELKGLKGDYVLFMDDNLIGHSKQEKLVARELFEGMIRHGLNKKWIMQTSINAADDESLLALASKAGCLLAFVGFETIDEAALEHMKKRANLKVGVEHYRKAVAAFHRQSIGVIGAFVTGNDGESDAYYSQLAEFLVHSGIDGFQVTILTPLPGTALMDRMASESRLVCTDFPADWDKFRFSYVVHQPEGVTAGQIYEGNNRIKNRIYSFPAFHLRMMRSFLSLRGGQSFYAVYKYNKALRKGWQHSHYYERNSGSSK